MVATKKSKRPAVLRPEILHALAHGDKTVRALAGRALRSIIFGEVDVLGGPAGRRRRQARRRFWTERERMEELSWISPSRTRQMATPTLYRSYLAVTELDDAWDVAEDEWNLLVQRMRDRGEEGGAGAARRPVRRKALLVWRASRRDSTRPRRKSPRPPASSPGTTRSCRQPRLSFNTRARCAVCGVGCSERRCARCRNVLASAATRTATRTPSGTGTKPVPLHRRARGFCFALPPRLVYVARRFELKFCFRSRGAPRAVLRRFGSQRAPEEVMSAPTGDAVEPSPRRRRRAPPCMPQTPTKPCSPCSPQPSTDATARAQTTPNYIGEAARAQRVKGRARPGSTSTSTASPSPPRPPPAPAAAAARLTPRRT